MKLSEAIRLGSLLSPQIFGELENHNGTCAMGAAFKAIGYDNKIRIVKPPPEWESLLFSHCRCPECDRLLTLPESERRIPTHKTSLLLVVIVSHLNDYHEWTREAIADWVATQEVAGATIHWGRPENTETKTGVLVANPC